MRRLTDPWLSADATRAVCAALGDAGHQVYFVGGCVRDALMGRPVNDIDLATNAAPEDVITAVDAAGLRHIPTGPAHGTVTVLSQNIPFEVTTFRRDISTDGRNATVAFAETLEEDAARRDFTMNALYATPGGEVVDPLGGLPDLDARRIRFIGDPGARIEEDYLRILRFFRFYAWFGRPEDGPDADGLAAIAEHLDGIERLSPERIGAEMTKLLAAPDPAPAMAAMEQTGTLARVLPGADTRLLAPLIHSEGTMSFDADPIRRLAAIGGETVKEALRLSNSDAARLDILRDEMATGRPDTELAYRHGVATTLDILALRAALTGQTMHSPDRTTLAEAAAAICPVTAADLMPDYEGPALGEKLRAVEKRWLASGMTLDRAALLD